MKQRIEQFPNNLSEGIEIASNIQLNNKKEIRNIVFCGMGGSGFGGMMMMKWLYEIINVPFVLAQDYSIPNFVTENTLFIAASYSGNTEETLTATQLAKEKNATIFGICTGGKLKQFCDENNYDYVIVPGGLPPRSALGYAITQITGVLTKFNLIDETWMQQLEKSVSLINTHSSEIHSIAKNAVEMLYSKKIIIYSESRYEALAIRLRQQIHENSKVLCSHHVLPEMNHNEIVGWAGGSSDYAVIFLETDDCTPQIKTRFEYTKEIIQAKNASIISLKPAGSSMVEKSMYFVHLCDWISYYLGVKNGVDIVEVDVIEGLKKRLASS
jgi:glucose/mannose-6-phosphate isomerase